MSSTHSLLSWLKIDFFSFLEFMALRMTMFYGSQIAQVNEEPPW
jgi:hypothetical protein